MPDTVISTIKDPRLSAFRRRPEDAAIFHVEGGAMIRQGMEAGWTPLSALFLDPVPAQTSEVHRALSAAATTHRATRGVFYKILGLGYETATDAIGVFAVPGHGVEVLDRRAAFPGALCLVCEDIQDPRNVGVIVRTAEALGVEVVVLSRPSAWPWSRAAIRSSTGSIFRVAIHVASSAEEAIRELRRRGHHVVGSSARVNLDVVGASIPLPCTLVVGNESTGLSGPTLELCDTVVSIPMAGGAHSLNVTVAAGILLDSLRRRRGRV